MPSVPLSQRLISLFFALCALAAVTALLVLALLVPSAAPSPPADWEDVPAWFLDIEQRHVPSYPPLARLFGTYTLEQIELCHAPLVDRDPEAFRYSSRESLLETCAEAVRSLRARYFGCVAVLMGVWLVACAMFVGFAYRPRFAWLFAVAVSTAITSPIGTELLLHADYGGDLFALVSPLWLGILALGVILTVHRWPRSSPTNAAFGRALGVRTLFALLVLLAGIGTAIGGAHENDEAIIKLGVALCTAACSLGVRIFLTWRRE